MSDTLEQIEELVRKHVEETKKSWSPGEDWVAYSGPVFDGEEYVAAIKQLLSGWLIFGKNARQFERKFPEHLGMKYGSLTNSGSSANLLAISALKSKRLFGLEEGSKLITPVVCFPTTINPIIQNGFQLVFVDVQ